MTRRRFPSPGAKALAALACSSLAFAAIVAGCSDDAAVDAGRGDSGTAPATLGDSVCPDAAPATDEACLLPEGTTCAFGGCDSRIAECTRGVWRYSGNPPLRPQCPKDFPVAGSVCPACWLEGVVCTYGSSDCSAPDASANTTVASCSDAGAGQAQRWTLRSFPCAGGDAGTNVQGDADADAD